jgi:hypothetical protein
MVAAHPFESMAMAHFSEEGNLGARILGNSW